VAGGFACHEQHFMTHRFLMIPPRLVGTSVVFRTATILPAHAPCAPSLSSFFGGPDGTHARLHVASFHSFSSFVFSQPSRYKYCQWHTAALAWCLLCRCSTLLLCRRRPARRDCVSNSAAALTVCVLRVHAPRPFQPPRVRVELSAESLEPSRALLVSSGSQKSHQGSQLSLRFGRRQPRGAGDARLPRPQLLLGGRPAGAPSASRLLRGQKPRCRRPPLPLPPFTPALPPGRLPPGRRPSRLAARKAAHARRLRARWHGLRQPFEPRRRLHGDADGGSGPRRHRPVGRHGHRDLDLQLQ